TSALCSLSLHDALPIASNVLAAVASAITVDVSSNKVLQACFSNFDATFEQVNHLLSTSVLQHFHAANSHRADVLLEVELSCANWAIRSDVNDIIPAVRPGGAACAIVVHDFFHNMRSTSDRTHITTLI